MCDVSIIIVNYNTTSLVTNCISSIFKKTKEVSYEIIIVDNNSFDSIDNIVPVNKPEGVKVDVIKLNENLGFGKANNKGFELSRGRNILFLNPDTILINNAIDILSIYLDSNPNVGVCGGNLYDSSLNSTRSFRRIYPSIEWLIGNFFLSNKYERIKYRNNYNFNNTSFPLEVAYIVGADLMIKRSVLEDCGCFDPRFFMYYEEIELCYRVKQNGYKILSIPSAKIQHLEGKSSSNWELKSKLRYNSSMIYYKTIYSKVGYLIVKMLVVMTAISRILLSFLLRDKERLVYWKVQFFEIITLKK